MKSLFLRRIAMSEAGTFGLLIDNKVPIFSTLELPDKNNQRDISCIPEGSYICKRIISPTYGETFEITDVNGRTSILFHWGNWIHDTEGCVLLGKRFAMLNDKPGIASSKVAHREFMAFFEGEDEFALTIQNSYLYGTMKNPMGPNVTPA